MIMSTGAGQFAAAIAVGLGATFFMDLWTQLMKRVLQVPAPNYCLVGRWLCHLQGGTLNHASIGSAPQMPAECAVGWVAHYVLGAAYALILISLVSGRWLAQPTLLPALLFGIGTVLVPFLLMQPAFGLGVAASRAPNPIQARLRSFMGHTAFGVGLYACAVGAHYVLGVHA